MVLVILSALLGGCSEKGTGPGGSQETALRPLAGHGPPPDLKFTAPEGWITESPSSSMRKAQYRLPKAEGDPEDAEMVVFFFAGQGGSVQANVDRWIGQFSKPDGSPAADAARVTRTESNGIPLTIVDVRGTYSGSTGPMMSPAQPKPNFRMLAAIAETSRGPYFFKLTGPAGTVIQWESSFRVFLDSIEESG